MKTPLLYPECDLKCPSRVEDEWGLLCNLNCQKHSLNTVYQKGYRAGYVKAKSELTPEAIKGFLKLANKDRKD